MKRAPKQPAPVDVNAPPPVQMGDTCAFPVADKQKRASLCLKPATAARWVPTGFGDEKIDMTFCAKHNAAIDAHGGDIKAAATAEMKAKRGAR